MIIFFLSFRMIRNQLQFYDCFTFLSIRPSTFYFSLPSVSFVIPILIETLRLIELLKPIQKKKEISVNHSSDEYCTMKKKNTSIEWPFYYDVFFTISMKQMSVKQIKSPFFALVPLKKTTTTNWFYHFFFLLCELGLLRKLMTICCRTIAMKTSFY